MVKVTFNSALAQKEAKKDEPKSGEEALIIPHDAVAVDCKVRARRSGCGGWGLGSRGCTEGTGFPGGGSAPRSFVPRCRVQEAVLTAGSGFGGPRGEPLKVAARSLSPVQCSPVGCVGPGPSSFYLGTRRDRQNNNNRV